MILLQHLLKYPVINDGIHTIKANEYGQRSINIGDSAYQTIAANLFPWIQRPYNYVSPYVNKADNLGDQTLNKIDERFPAVKKPTNDLYNETRSFVLLPFNKGLEGRDHVFQVYSSEYKKNEQAGVIAHGKAAVLTALVVSNETLTWLSSFIKQKANQGNEVVNEKVNQ